MSMVTTKNLKNHHKDDSLTSLVVLVQHATDYFNSPVECLKEEIEKQSFSLRRPNKTTIVPLRDQQALS